MTHNYPLTRADAKKVNSKLYFTGRPCARGHIATRYTTQGICSECSRENAINNYTHTTNKRRGYNDLGSFTEHASKIHNGLYGYDNAVYLGSHQKLAITCRIHGDFMQSPTNHVNGKGCPSCKGAAVAARSKSNTAAFIESAEVIWHSRFDYSSVVYTAAHAPVEIKCPLHGSFLQTPTNHLTGKLGCPRCNHMRSTPEDNVASLLSTFTNVVQRDRTILKPKELDIVLPDKNLAVEYCGEYWHSHGDQDHEVKNSMNHYRKYIDCKALGVRLITLFETEWKERNYAVRRLLRNAIGKSKGRVMARKCEFRYVEHKDAVAFYNRYHPQGGAGGGEHYGLYWKGKLVACMRFTEGANDRGHNRRRMWTLTRYATRITVAGGASRLFTAFLRDKNPKEVKSFSDNRFFDGKMYLALGFELVEETKPDYLVWHPKLGILPKSAWQRRSIPLRAKELGVTVDFDPETDPRSERDMTYLLGGRRIYDCGKKRWEWRR